MCIDCRGTKSERLSPVLQRTSESKNVGSVRNDENKKGQQQLERTSAGERALSSDQQRRLQLWRGTGRTHACE